MEKKLVEMIIRKVPAELRKKIKATAIQHDTTMQSLTVELLKIGLNAYNKKVQ